MILPAFSVLADKPLKKRKQDSYPQESETMDGAGMQVSNTDSSLTPKKTIPASNGGTRPALMVSIDLEKAGRLIGQPVVVLDSKSLCEDPRLHVKSDRKTDRAPADNRTESSKQHADNPRRPASDGQAESPRVSQERQSDAKRRQDGRVDNDRGPSENKRQDVVARPKHNRHSDKNHDGHQPHVSQPETVKSASKADSVSRHSEDKVRERNKDADRHQSKDRDRIKDREVVRDRVVEKDRHKDKDRNEQKNTDKDRDKNKVVDKNRYRDKDRERNKNLEMDKEISRNVETDKERVRDKQEDKTRERNKNTEIERCRDKKRDKEIEKERERSKNTDVDKGKDRNTDKEIEKNKERKKHTDSEKDTDRNRDKEISRDRNREDRNKDRDLDRARNKDKDRDKERSRDKDRDRERNLQTCRENSHRQSPNKVDGLAGKQERNRKPIDGQNRPRTENPGGESGPARSKDTKAVEFPAYLLGGKSRSLKNFVIPKLPRDGRDPQLANKLRGGWVEPLVRLERVSLVESLKNKASPTVTVQRLSAEEVRRIIREGREAQRSRARKWSNLNKPQRGETTFQFYVWSLSYTSCNALPSNASRIVTSRVPEQAEARCGQQKAQIRGVGL